MNTTEYSCTPDNTSSANIYVGSILTLSIASCLRAIDRMSRYFVHSFFHQDSTFQLLDFYTNLPNIYIKLAMYTSSLPAVGSIIY